MGSVFSNNQDVKCLLCLIDVLTKYALFKPLKYKKAKTVLYVFIEFVTESNRKLHKLWADQGREFYNNLMPKWLDDNYILTYSTHSEGKSVDAERFIGTFKGKIYYKIRANGSKYYLRFLN